MAKKRILDALYRAVSRTPAPTGKESAADLVTRAEQALGSKKAVADRLGVSTRTVERWAKREGRWRSKPKAQHEQMLRDLARNAPEARARSMSPLRAARIRNKGATLRVTANMGPSYAGKKYRRERTIEVQLSGDAMQPVIDKWLSGDDAGAMEALHSALDEEYLAGFELGDVVDVMDLLR
ncbi:hypothetical protein AB0L75_42465 [Streptomyces sp. NPDC052101]|uniref:hypothetical protein n=1 Tax=Streptomyces sp. NPDC052101 TaxID=3155763 RepID=UPI003437FD7B